MISSHAAPPPTDQAAANPWQAHTVAVQAVTAELDDVTTYDLVFQEEAVRNSYRFAPGQFNMLYLPGAGEMAISVSDDPQNRKSCGHTIRLAGNVTRSLARLKIGDTLGLRGPFGTCWPLDECIGRDVILVSGGIGLAPLRPAIHTLLSDRRQFGRLNLLYGARLPDTMLYARQYDDWSRGGMIVHTTVDRSSPNWTGNVGVVTLLLERLRTFDPRNTVLFCCGPEVMMRFTARAALERGLSPEQIWISLERNMQCAIGLCGHCQLGTEFICKDGPVFRYDRIAPLLDVEGL